VSEEALNILQRQLRPPGLQRMLPAARLQKLDRFQNGRRPSDRDGVEPLLTRSAAGPVDLRLR
jgi:hypothetical protein